MSNTLPERRTPESLTEDELSLWLETCLTPTEAQPSRTNLDALTWLSWRDVQSKHHGTLGYDNWARSTADATASYIREGLVALYGSCYGTHDPTELARVFGLDLETWNRMYVALLKVNAGDDEPPLEGECGLDMDIARSLSFPAGNTQFLKRNGQNPYMNSLSYKDYEISAVQQRLRDGMPRQMLLLGVYMLLPGRHIQDIGWLEASSARFKVLCDELNLSDDELRAVYFLASETHEVEKSDFLSVVLTRDDLADRFVDAEGEFMIDLFGGEEALRLWAERAFALIIEANGFSYVNSAGVTRSDTIGHFLRGHRYLGALLDQTFTDDDRIKAVHAAEVARASSENRLVSVDLHPFLTQYVDAPQLTAELMSTHEALLAAEPKRSYSFTQRPPSYHARELEIKLDVNLQTEILRYAETPHDALIKRILELTSEDDATQQEVNRRYVDKVKAYDPELIMLISEYAKLANDGSLQPFGQGFSDEDDEEWFKERERGAAEIKVQLEDLERMILEHVTSKK